ncbi:CarD family transcriptional regulator [Deinococcus sp.]|uniref:CarD family transcriptional regulator n=1 Tax=Deinococcus sp. TaxID=47478 RepID=UPI003C799784
MNSIDVQVAAGKTPHPPFRPGDRVMVPPYGIGVVRETCSRQVAGRQAAYYAIEFPESSSRAFVPVDAPTGSGMRPALTSRETPRLLRHLREGRLQLQSQWSARQRQVTEILVSGDPFDLATLTCELRRWNVDRGLPDLDRQAFRQAIKLLEQEVRGLEDLEAKQVRELLGSAWNETPQELR